MLIIIVFRLLLRPAYVFLQTVYYDVYGGNTWEQVRIKLNGKTFFKRDEASWKDQITDVTDFSQTLLTVSKLAILCLDLVVNL
jgi:hypothetical protein